LHTVRVKNIILEINIVSIERDRFSADTLYKSHEWSRALRRNVHVLSVETNL